VPVLRVHVSITDVALMLLLARSGSGMKWHNGDVHALCPSACLNHSLLVGESGVSPCEMVCEGCEMVC
jgi:hypothetical protein